MTRLEALTALKDAVESGTAMHWGFASGFPRIALSEHWDLRMSAFCGSLDAARALHEAVLPGWGWLAGNRGAVCVLPPGGRGAVAVSRDEPARAWLIAILSALIAQEQEQ